MDLIQTDKNRLVVGLGATGLSTLRFMQRAGLRCAAFDTRADFQLDAALRAEFAGIDIYLGELPAERLLAADEIYLSPGLAPELPELADALAHGAMITGDLDLFMQNVQAPVIAITGSNAKSTVTTLVGELAAQKNLRVGVGGNLGTPMLDLLAQPCDLYVLELSSFQLERAHHFNFAVACVLNITADHMDRHQSMMRYHQIKQKVYSEAKVALYNRGDQLTYPLQRAGLQAKSFGLQVGQLEDYGLDSIDGRECIVKGVQAVLPVESIVLPGRHNLLNIMAALAIVDAAGLDMQGLAAQAAAFKGLPHRCELVATIDGVRYINDSKATNVGAAVAALQGLDVGAANKIYLIAGGQTKAADFAPLAAQLTRQSCELILLGEGAAEVGRACAGAAELHYVDGIPAAVRAAHVLAQAGDLVLLSPACASFDSYTGYAQRGDDFKQAVLALSGGIDSGDRD